MADKKTGSERTSTNQIRPFSYWLCETQYWHHHECRILRYSKLQTG